MIILMYPIILIARGLAITLFFPIVRRLGTKATWKDAVIMWWGGLRGSVGLALGLAVHHTVYDSNMWGTGSSTYTHGKNGELKTSLDCRDQPMMVLYLTVLVVSGTVIINGVTMAPLMKKLKMTDTPDERKYSYTPARLPRLPSSPPSPSPPSHTSPHRTQVHAHPGV